MNKTERTPVVDMDCTDSFSDTGDTVVSNPLLPQIFIYLFYLLLKQSYRDFMQTLL